jgi:hypothetical protein
LIEEDNKKERAKERRKYNEMVHDLAKNIRDKDKRMDVFRK